MPNNPFFHKHPHNCERGMCTMLDKYFWASQPRVMTRSTVITGVICPLKFGMSRRAIQLHYLIPNLARFLCRTTWKIQVFSYPKSRAFLASIHHWAAFIEMNGHCPDLMLHPWVSSLSHQSKTHPFSFDPILTRVERKGLCATPNTFLPLFFLIQSAENDI